MKTYKYILLMLTVLIINSGAYGQFRNWFKTGDMPYPVAGGKAVVIDTTIYVIGGYSDSTQTNVDFIQAYYPESNKWEIVGHLPEPRYGFSAGVIDNKIVLCGGISDPENENSSLQIITKDSTGFSFYKDTSFRYNRVFSAGLIHNRNLFLFGGLSASGFQDTSDKAYIIRYDFATSNTVFKEEKIYPNLELPIQQMSVSLYDKIYLFGGVYNGVMKDIYMFDPDSNRYSKLTTSLLEPRAGGEAVAFPENGQIMLIGGYKETSDALFSTELLTFYPDFIMVEQQEPLNDPRKEFMAVNYGNFTIVMGGRDADDKVISSIEIMEHYAVVSVDDDYQQADFHL